MKKFNLEKSIKSLVIVLLLTALILSIFIFYTPAQKNYYTVYADEGYYSETTYLLSEDSYQQYVQMKNVTKEIRQQNSLQTTVLNDNHEFVGAVVQNVWVSEKTDRNGMVVESNLMTKKELDEFKEAQALAQNLSQSTTLTTGETTGEKVEDSEASKYRLTIELAVYHIMPADTYYVVAKSSWKQEWVWFWMGNEAAEEGSEDVMGITWGGSGRIKALNNSISGRYYDNAGSVTFYPVEEGRFDAYIWSFLEKSGWCGKELQDATATLTLKSLTNENTETNIKLSYIHTYNSIDISGSIGISAGSDISVAPSLTIGATSDAWKIGIDCGGVFY